MKKLINRVIPSVLVVSGIMLMAFLNSCKQEHINYSTTSDVNIYTYLEQNPDQFSLFKQIVDKAGYASFLDTYGTYTLFAPDNAGVTAYLKSQNKASVDNIDAATAKKIVSISLISDTLGTQLFTDGKMRSPTTAGQYLITGAINKNGASVITINKQANLVKGNIRVGNGIIHIIDNVLIAANLTLAQTIEQNSKYSIFSAALKATGFYDTLNVAAADNQNVSRKFLTLIAQTDSVFNAAGIADFNALKQKYSTLNDPKNPKDSLYLFVAYRIWPELSYVSDIANSTSHSTLAPREITTSQLVGQNILLNNDVFNGVLEPGQQIDRPNSDVSCTNGVLHNVLTNYKIKVRLPSPVYFDVADQPEIRRTPGLYRGASKSQPFQPGELAGVILTGKAGNYVTYLTEPAVPKSGDYYFNNDWLEIGLRFRTGNNGTNAVEFITPVIVRGRYKVWADYKRTQSKIINVTFDGVAMPNAFNSGDGLNNAETDPQAEARGFKSYSDSPPGNPSTSSGYNNHVGRLLGVVDVATTDHHSIKFTATAGTGDKALFDLDVIEFRPIDMDQIHPRLGRDGTLVP